MLDRRLVLAAVFSGITAATAAQAAPPVPSGTVKVDVSRLRAQGLGPNASRIQAALERELAGVSTPGTSIVVTVRGISMPSYTGSEGRFGGGGSQDGIDSEVSVIGPGGRLIATYPVLSSSSPDMAGAWYTPGIDQLRLDAMARVNAGWIRRYVTG